MFTNTLHCWLFGSIQLMIVQIGAYLKAFCVLEYHFQSFQTPPLKVGDEFILKPLRGKKGKKMMML